MTKKCEYVRLKKSPFMIYADCENIVVPEDNIKQNPKTSYASKYQKHIVCSLWL